MANKKDQVYDMVNTKVGQFIIINNETFVKKDKRVGSEHDVKKLEATFGEVFGFDVTVHEDKTAEEITDIIQTLGKGDYSKCDCIGIAILTHGKRYSDRVIFGCDEQELDLEKLLEPIKNCESLAGKPKFILVQAGPLHVTLFDHEKDGGGSSKPKTIPKEADCSGYYAMNIPAGCNDWKFAEMGSIFVQTFCKILQDNSAGEDRVDFETLKTQANGKIWDECKQMPLSYSTLTKKFFLPSGSPQQPTTAAAGTKRELEENGGNSPENEDGKPQKKNKIEDNDDVHS